MPPCTKRDRAHTVGPPPTQFLTAPSPRGEPGPHQLRGAPGTSSPPGCALLSSGTHTPRFTHVHVLIFSFYACLLFAYSVVFLRLCRFRHINICTQAAPAPDQYQGAGGASAVCMASALGAKHFTLLLYLAQIIGLYVDYRIII